MDLATRVRSVFRRADAPTTTLPTTLPRIEPKLDFGRPRYRAAYMQGDASSPFLYSWVPALREAPADVMRSYNLAAARAVETIQNSGWISGGVDQSIASTVGAGGLRLSLKPDAVALRWTEAAAANWARNVEARFENWASRPIDCDLTGRATLGKMTAQALRSYYGFGEITAALPFIRRDGGQYGTKVQMLPPNRLVQDLIPNVTPGRNLVYGITQDVTGFPLAYRIRTPFDGFTPYDVRDIPVRDPFGRPQFVHAFDGVVGQPRGISPMVAVLKVVRQYDQLSDATLTQALIQAIFAATVTSPDPTEVTLSAFQEFAEQQMRQAGGAKPGEQMSTIEAMLEARAGFYEGTKIDLTRHGKIAHLAPGDELVFHKNLTPNEFYESFTRILLREIARGLGVTFEELTGDFSSATYSSVRMSTATNFGIVLYRRANIIAPFLQPIFEAWLEEEIEMGWTPFPGGIDAFIGQRAPACRAMWRGPAKPSADEFKMAKSMSELRKMGVVSDEWICNELGEDWEDVYAQRAKEAALRKELKLPELPLLTATVQSDAEPIDQGGDTSNTDQALIGTD